MVTAHQTIPELDRKGLRKFGFTTGAIVAVLFGLLFPWLLNLTVPLWPWALCGVLGLWALLAPATLRSVYWVWMRFGLLMSGITTPIILGIVFFAVITPVALVRRLMGKDSLARKIDRETTTYRIESRKGLDNNLQRPF